MQVRAFERYVPLNHLSSIYLLLSLVHRTNSLPDEYTLYYIRMHKFAKLDQDIQCGLSVMSVFTNY